MNETVWVHNLDPFLIQFTETFGIRWYGLAYLAGFIVGAMFMIFLARRGRQTLRPDMVTDYVTYIVLGTMIGGRLGYALFYSQDLLTDFSSQFPFWGVLRVWEGGMASHGGILGIILAAALFARRHKLNWLHLGDLVVLGGSIGIFFGRIANFINGELFGREASASLPWAVKFPAEMFLWLKHDAEKKLSDLSAGADFLPKLTETMKTMGLSTDQWMSWVSQVRTSRHSQIQIQGMIERAIEAVQSGNETVRIELAKVLTPRHPSQIYEALLEGAFLFVVLFLFWRKPRKAGVVGALWLTLYAIVRIIGEQFRMPDAHIGYQFLNLTRGQWLSIGMLAFSVLFLAWTLRRPAPLISGWGPEAQRLRDEDEKKSTKSKR